MKIEHIFIAGCKQDFRWTQCCVASIRRWYPCVRISLLKDLSRGCYDTSEMETYWDVAIAPGTTHNFGWGMAKLEPLFAATGERVLVLDSDILFLDPVLDALEPFDEDFIVDDHVQPEANIDLYYFDRIGLQALDPDFTFPGYIFNTGVLVATSGQLTRADFEPFVDFTPPPRLRYGSIFKCADQGILNYVILEKAQLGRLSLRRLPLQEWAGYISPRSVRIRNLHEHSPYRYILHYAGPKKTLFSANRNGHLLRHFEAAYYDHLPQGRRRRCRDRLHRLLDVIRRRLSWTQYI
ncbi:MAG: hypothetical protein U1F76_07000 [Candidatus Competibacteraceae bacterium]